MTIRTVLPLFGLLAGCGPGLPETDVVVLDVPAILRPGTPLRAHGHDLAGAQIRLDDVRAPLPTLDTTGSLEVADGQMPATQWPQGKPLRLSCVQTPNHAERCLPIQATWDLTLPAAEVLSGSKQIWLGEDVSLTTTELLLPGEGELQVDMAVEQTLSTQPLLTRLETGRKFATVRATADWLGQLPGPRTCKMRIRQTAHGQTVVGPWSQPWTLTLLPPDLQVLPQTAVRRGGWLPVTVRGVPDQGWQLLLTGRWDDAPPLPAPLQLDGELDHRLGRVALHSVWYFAHIAPLLPQLGPHPTLHGQVQVQMVDGAQVWLGPPVDVQWTLAPTIQGIVVQMDEDFVAGLSHLGLSAFASEIRERVVELAQQHFVGLSVQVGLLPPATLAEYLVLAVIDVDPNGKDLLGNDNSPGKDVGNLLLDERLAGFNRAGQRAGSNAYGGVFLKGLLLFSAQLNPGGPVASPQFDALFGPYAPELGGLSATRASPPTAAIEAVAQLIACEVTHETGHALGLAAAPNLYHHAGDNPGWIMDAGTARGFAERAALPGALPQIWGEVDWPYLQTILPPQ